MGATWDGMLRDQLLDRRRRLVSALDVAHGQTGWQRRALEDDLDLASRIQSGLLPKSTRFEGWEVSFPLPARGGG